MRMTGVVISSRDCDRPPVGEDGLERVPSEVEHRKHQRITGVNQAPEPV
jgi:hypothetical protein